MSWKEVVECTKFDTDIIIPEQDRVKVSILQKPFEEVIYNRMLRLSYENARNFCRISYAAIQDTTSLRSKNAVITGIQGLIEKKHIIKLLNNDGKPEMTREGTLYRVLSPQEALRGVLDDGTIVSEINRDGMNFTMIEKLLHIEEGVVPQDTSLENEKNGYVQQDHSRADKSSLILRAVLPYAATFIAGAMLVAATITGKSYLDSVAQGNRNSSNVESVVSLETLNLEHLQFGLDTEGVNRNKQEKNALESIVIKGGKYENGYTLDSNILKEIDTNNQDVHIETSNNNLSGQDRISEKDAKDSIVKADENRNIRPEISSEEFIKLSVNSKSEIEKAASSGSKNPEKSAVEPEVKESVRDNILPTKKGDNEKPFNKEDIPDIVANDNENTQLEAPEEKPHTIIE